MTWKEIIEEINRQPQDFKKLKAVVIVNIGTNQCSPYEIVEICSRGLGGRDAWIGAGFDDPRNNDEYDITIWTEPSRGEHRDYRGMTWKNIIDDFHELLPHFAKLEAVVTVDTKEEYEYKYYKIVGVSFLTLCSESRFSSIDEDSSNYKSTYFITAETQSTDRESSGSLSDERDKKIDNLFTI